MPTLLAVGQYVQLRVWCTQTLARQASVNSAWYVVSAVGASPALDTDFATQMDSTVGPAMKAIINVGAVYNGCQAIIHSQIPPYPALAVPAQATANAGAGTAGPTPCPFQTCGILRFQTDRPGPSGRGRWYLPFPSTLDQDINGFPTAAYITDALALGGEVGVGISVSASGRTAVLVRALVHGKNKLGVYPAPSPVVDFTIDPVWGTQKRRGSFGRTNVSPI